MSERRYYDEAWLREQYAEEERTMADIAEECGVDHTTIRYWLKKYGIETRRDPAPADERLENPEWLREQVQERGRSVVDIAGECGCSQPAISNWLRKHGIRAGGGGR